jgi:Cdc6-like AAA superfamily ATPase
MTKETISDETKTQISTDLSAYVTNVAGGSANKASKMLTGISNAYISNMLNGKWEMISDDAWRNVQKQVSNSQTDWVTVDTKATQKLTKLFQDAKDHANVFGIIAEAGTGKTHVCKAFDTVDNVFVLSCAEYWNRKTFLSELMRKMGIESSGYTVWEMMAKVINHVQRVDTPLIVLDEADKLADQVFYFFITLYNQLEGKCGIILLATNFLERRVNRGLRLNKKGYKEIYSRIGRKFIEIPQPKAPEVKALLMANGITDALTIQAITNAAEGDLRRVKRLVHAERQKSRREVQREA